MQAIRRRSARNRLPADVPDALFLLQRVRRLAIPGAVEATLGDICGRLFRVVPLGTGGIRLASDRAGNAEQLPGPRGADRLRSAGAVQLQPAAEAGRLLPSERLA